MSNSGLLYNGLIASQFLPLSSIVIPISQVTNLQTNLNALQAEINALPSANFYEAFALMPSDNSATVAVGAAVLFPQNGAHAGAISRSSTSQLLLPAIGTYEVSFQVSVTEAGQLQLAVGGVGVANTVVRLGQGEKIPR